MPVVELFGSQFCQCYSFLLCPWFVVVAGPGKDIPGLVVFVAGGDPSGGSMVAAVSCALRCVVWGTSVYWPALSACSRVLVPCHCTVTP